MASPYRSWHHWKIPQEDKEGGVASTIQCLSHHCVEGYCCCSCCCWDENTTHRFMEPLFLSWDLIKVPHCVRCIIPHVLQRECSWSSGSLPADGCSASAEWNIIYRQLWMSALDKDVTLTFCQSVLDCGLFIKYASSTASNQEKYTLLCLVFQNSRRNRCWVSSGRRVWRISGSGADQWSWTQFASSLL